MPSATARILMYTYRTTASSDAATEKVIRKFELKPGRMLILRERCGSMRFSGTHWSSRSAAVERHFHLAPTPNAINHLNKMQINGAGGGRVSLRTRVNGCVDRRSGDRRQCMARPGRSAVCSALAAQCGLAV
eukprot:6210426-Pleurochrysis_carterae.AAC.1